jgi:hypothetical protein
MLKKAVQVAGSLAAGVAADRLSQPPQQNKPEAPPKPLRTGNAILGGLSERVKVPADAQSPIAHGATSQVQNRVSLADKLSTIAKHPSVASDNASKAVGELKEDVKFLKGAAEIAQGGALTAGDGARLAKAGAQSAENSILAMAKGLYAGATTSPQKVKELSETVTDRATYEATSIAAGVGASQAIAAAVGTIPHPAAKLAAATIRVTGQAAAGAKASEAARTLNADIAGPIRKEVVAIAKEKSEQPPSASKTDS